jgi:hypothetical protein
MDWVRLVRFTSFYSLGEAASLVIRGASMKHVQRFMGI